MASEAFGKVLKREKINSLKQMKHYFIEFEINNSVYFGEHIIVQPDEWLRDKYDGHKLKEQPNIVLPDSRGELTEHLENIQSLLILREDLVEILEDIEKESVQKFEVAVRNKRDFKYYYIHTLNNIRGVDLDKSEVSQPIPEVPVFNTIKNLTLIESKVESRNIFRLEEIKTKLIVSECVKNRIEAEGKFKYTIFTPCDGYDWT